MLGRKTKALITGCKQALAHSNPYMRTLYIFNTISLLGGTIYGLYYGVFLYRHTFSLSILAIDGLLGGVGVWLGYLVGVLLIRKRGYGLCIRLAFGLWVAVALATALIADHIAAWFMLLAVVKSLPGGMYTAVADTVMLREVKTGARSGFLQLNLALEFVASIILPSLVGALISVTQGYEWAFVASAGVYAAAFLYRCKLPKPNLQLNLREVLHTFKKPLYPHHALNRTLATGFNQLNAFALTIIPFLLLKNELSMGLLTSATALLAAAVALGAGRLKDRHHLKVGYGAYGVRSLAGLLFVGSWSAPFMAAWQLVGKVVTPLHDPLQQSLDIHNDSLIMGADARSKALQINILNNTLALIGTSLALGGFVLLTRQNTTQQHAILQVIIMGYAAWRFINLSYAAWINKRARNPKEYVSWRTKILLYHALWQRAFENQLGKLQYLFEDLR